MAHGTIIFLNGPTSSGKTTLAHALQASLDQPYYHLAQDTFTHLISKQHRASTYQALTNQSISAMHHTIALYSALGLPTIVDHVILDTPDERLWLRECVQLLHTHPVLFVGVECSLEELERRERTRGDRWLGQARAQRKHLYSQEVYDLTINTSTHTIAQCTELVQTALVHLEDCAAFRALFQRWFSIAA